MARPTKQGIDYFPLDTELDTKLKMVEAKYGCTGFTIVIKLWMLIYREQGYYTKWGEDEQLLFFSAIRDVDMDTSMKIMSDFFKWEIFDKNMYEKYDILTSRGTQRRYFSAISRRTKVEANFNFLLINIKEYKLEIINSNNNRVNVDNNEVNVGKKYTKESKVKESKVKERRERQKPPPPRPPDDDENLNKKMPDKAVVVAYGEAKGMPKEFCNKFFFHFDERKWKGVQDWKARIQKWWADEFDRPSVRWAAGKNNFESKNKKGKVNYERIAARAKAACSGQG